MNNLNDNELLWQWQSGDENAFTAFYKRHLSALLSIAMKKTGAFEQSREIVQDTFIVFYKNRDKINDNPLLYIQQILKFKILEYYKKNKKEKEKQLEINNLPNKTENEYWDKMYYAETNKRIMNIIDSLPEQQKKVFLMSRMEQLSNKEIAAILNISIKTVEAHITKALKQLRNYTIIVPIFLNCLEHIYKQ